MADDKGLAARAPYATDPAGAPRRLVAEPPSPTRTETVTAAPGWNPVPPRRVPIVGQILDLQPGDVKYCDRAMRIRVSRCRPDISQWYDGGWVWVHAEVLDDRDQLINVLPILINVDAIPDNPTGPRTGAVYGIHGI